MFEDHDVGLPDLGAFNRVAPFDPSGEALIENFHVPVAFFVQYAIGQTGHVMGASSIEYHESILRDALNMLGKIAKGRRNRP
jgi:hypothetical protein